MTQTPQLISNPSQVTMEWLTGVFRHTGMQVEINSIKQESIGTGQIGENVRYTIQGSDHCPTSVVGKFMSLEPISRETGIQQETYIREVFFYNQLQQKADIETPNIFFCDSNTETHEFVIIMEDLAPGTQGDQIKGCEFDEAAIALDALAKLHGPYWGNESLEKFQLLNKSDDVSKVSQLQMIYQLVLPGFLERYSERLSPEHINIIEEMLSLLPKYPQLYSGPKTLIHSDYRLDNMMFGGPRPITIVDWQTIGLGCGLNDASYFLGTSLTSENRVKHEIDLLKIYHEVLTSYDIQLSWDDCWRHYRAHSASGLIMAVIASMVVTETERGNDMFMAMAKRSCQQVIELECFSLFN